MTTESTNKNQDLREGISKLGKYFRNVIDLSQGVEKRSVIEEISIQKSMSGANSWMLMCSIVIASIGLDLNSAAVIIGAMLISPLMSPILAGFGISCGRWDIAASSFYLFLLNIFFVSLATYIIVRFLNFPFRKYIDEAERKKNVRYIAGMSVLLIIPSFFIFFKVYNKLNTKNKLKSFVMKYIAEDKIYLDDYQLIHADGKDQLVLKVYGDKINSTGIPYLEKGLKSEGVENVEIKIISTADINLDRIHQLEKNIAGVDMLESKIESIIDQQVEKEQKATILEGLPRYMAIDSIERKKSIELLKTAFPNLNNISLSYGIQTDSINQLSKMHFAIADWKNVETVSESDKDRLKVFLQKQYDIKELRVK